MSGGGLIAKAAVIGFPVSHSLSPRLHGYWLQHYGIQGEYGRLPVAPDALSEAISILRSDPSWQGANLTIPHKEAVMELLDEVDPVAQAIGAVNTVFKKEGKLYGTNTDAYGFAENIRSAITGKHKAVVLGAGGAAKAVCWALHELGFSEILMTNRSLDRAEALKQSSPFPLQIEKWEQRNQWLENADLLVNTTSLGMKHQPPLEMDLSSLPTSALVTDIVYNPLETALLAEAKARGNAVVDGLGMLLYQAVPGFEAWFGTRPEVTPALRAHVLAGLAL